MAGSRTVLPRKGLVQPQDGTAYSTDMDANLSLLDANVAFLDDLTGDPGFEPTAGAGFTLNISAGKGFLNGALASYAGGTLSLTASSTNYVFLDPGAGLQPAFNTSGFLAGHLPIAVVTTDGSGITNIADKRSWFNQTFGEIGAHKFLCGPTSGADAFPSDRVIDPSDLPVEAIQNLASVNLTAQTADIGATTLYTPPSGQGGLYRISAYIIVITVDGTSSTLPKVTIGWTDKDNSTAQTFDLTATDSGNLLTTLAQAAMVIDAIEAVAITYATSGYASGGTPMAYALHLKIEKL